MIDPRDTRLASVVLALTATATLAQERFEIADLHAHGLPAGIEVITHLNWNGWFISGHGFAPGDGRPRAISWLSGTDDPPRLMPVGDGDNSSLGWSSQVGASVRVRFEPRPGGGFDLVQDKRAVRWIDGLGGTVDVRFIEDDVRGPLPYRLTETRGRLATDQGIYFGVGEATLPSGDTEPRGWFLNNRVEVVDLDALTNPVATVLPDGAASSIILGWTADQKAAGWQAGAFIDLHEAAGISGQTSAVLAANRSETFVGWARFEPGGPQSPAIWEGRVARPLIDPTVRGQATDINNAGAIVGWWDDPDAPGQREAFIMPVGGQATALFDTVPHAPGAGWASFQTPYVIDDGNLIVGVGTHQDRAGRGFVLFDCGACQADLDGDCQLTLFDFLEFSSLFEQGDPAADFDGDGFLTIKDFLVYQNLFGAGCP